ncbi:MAG: hypothetical protein AVDCRST_MAG40-76, partial [uncultured Gemmatimonadaceae bacterium]
WPALTRRWMCAPRRGSPSSTRATARAAGGRRARRSGP